jgi:hypothetical protein
MMVPSCQRARPLLAAASPWLPARSHGSPLCQWSRSRFGECALVLDAIMPNALDCGCGLALAGGGPVGGENGSACPLAAA